MKREAGFYWVKWDGRWRIGEYAQGNWYLTQLLSYLYDPDFEEIDERRVTQWHLPSKCDHDFTGTDKNGFTICTKCGEGYE